MPDTMLQSPSWDMPKPIRPVARIPILAGSLPAYTVGSVHNFIRQNVDQLPTYTWWFDKYLKFPLFAGSMLDKLDISLKAKSIVEVDADFVRNCL